jgi:hypothetical protein
VPDERGAEEVREAIRSAVEQAVASALAWQRETEARIARAELDLNALRALEEARVTTPRAPELPAAVIPPAVGPPPLPVQPAPQVATYASIPVRFSLPGEEVPFDIGMLPDELNGGRRKRAIAWGALILLLVALGTLAAFAIASQAKHGL